MNGKSSTFEKKTQKLEAVNFMNQKTKKKTKGRRSLLQFQPIMQREKNKNKKFAKLN